MQRELAEYKKQPLFADTMLGTIRDQLAKLNFGDEDEADLLAKIQQLRNELVTNFARNDQIEKEQKVTEFLVRCLPILLTNHYHVVVCPSSLIVYPSLFLIHFSSLDWIIDSTQNLYL